MNTNRKGVVYVIEAVIAAIILFTFILTASQPTADPDTTADILSKTTYNTLSALDDGGALRGPVIDRDVDQIKNLVSPYLAGRTVEVALLAVNATTAEPRFTTSHTATFQVGTDTEREELRVWYRDAAASNVSINGQAVSNHTGTISDTYESFDITSYTDTGANTLQFDVDGDARIGYSIDIYDRYVSGTPPTGADVFSTSYLVSGVNASTVPAEVTVITWQ